MPLLKKGIITPFARNKKKKKRKKVVRTGKVTHKDSKELKNLKRLIAKRRKG